MTEEKVKSLFAFQHLPVHLQGVSEPFHDMAMYLLNTIPVSAELTLAIRHLWDAKNLAVYATVEACKQEGGA
jgi:hypothetical protein